VNLSLHWQQASRVCSETVKDDWPRLRLPGHPTSKLCLSTCVSHTPSSSNPTIDPSRLWQPTRLLKHAAQHRHGMHSAKCIACLTTSAYANTELQGALAPLVQSSTGCMLPATARSRLLQFDTPTTSASPTAAPAITNEQPSQTSRHNVCFHQHSPR